MATTGYSTRAGERAVEHGELSKEHGKAAAAEAAKDISTRAKEAKDYSATVGHETTKDIGGKIQESKKYAIQQAQEAYHAALLKAEEAKRAMEQSMGQVGASARRHPLVTTGSILLMGFLLGMGLSLLGFSTGLMAKSLVHRSYLSVPGREGNYGWPSGSIEAEAHKNLDSVLRSYAGMKEKTKGAGYWMKEKLGMEPTMGMGGTTEESTLQKLEHMLGMKGTSSGPSYTTGGGERESLMHKLFGTSTPTMEQQSLLDKLMGKGSSSSSMMGGEPSYLEKAKEMLTPGSTTAAYAGYKAKEAEEALKHPSYFQQLKEKVTGGGVQSQHKEVDDVSQRLHELLNEAQRKKMEL